MSEITVNGGRKLFGGVKIKGAKNAILPILAASVLIRGEVKLKNCPRISDIKNMLGVLRDLGAKASFRGNTIKINASKISKYEIKGENAKKIRGSIFLLGALLGRFGKATTFASGGCAIGARPIDLHLRGLEALGFKSEDINGATYIYRDEAIAQNSLEPATGFDPKNTRNAATAQKKALNAMREIKTREVFLDFASVGATENLILASVLGEETTRIVGAAREPEIVCLSGFLNAAGAKIAGAGTDEIIIDGVRELSPVVFEPIPDRIVCATYLLAVCATGGSITIKNTLYEHNENLIAKLRSVGAKIQTRGNSIKINVAELKKTPLSVHTAPWVGFPTDIQSQLGAMCAVRGIPLTITENLFENRFSYASELKKLGFNIEINGKTAKFEPTPRENLTNTQLALTAEDLRGGAALIIAALALPQKTTVKNYELVARGYEDIVADLKKLGADIYL
ncbi:MAG: UDP-N-acetylglucosamine 1-carboxyvinyltransferase [Christensenellaceae bacterium]|jgi:UDP-N-acetylglucosamine 1-carboxyvinyltransferase|nr:UDP-N-acetylglucosamine 1-carboxyvinyltransferase [Christensenellaceae bacterium]